MATATAEELTTGEMLAPWRPAFSPWLIAFAVMSATILEVLDTSVANVALPQMAGTLSVTTDEATWVLTSYLVANAIVLPMTGWLSTWFGRKRFLITCVALFTMASAFCGSAPTIGLLVFGRILQGAAGGALQPLSQAILMESFPPAKRGAAMALFGMGVVVAPIVGPTLGGWITDNYSWRWIFFLNMPLGILSVMMCRTFIEDPPYLVSARRRARQRGTGIDGVGFAFMTLWLATLQIILDKGQQDDWFAAAWIRWFSVISLGSMLAFIWWELRVEHPLVDLRVLRNRNFAVGTAMMTLLGVVLYSTITLLPLFLQNLMGYSALDSGMALSPRGIGAVMSMIIVGRLIGRIDGRLIITFGFLLLAYSSHMFSGITLGIAMSDIVTPNVIMGLAMGFVFVPLTTMTMGDLPNEQMGNGAGIFNLMRNLGGGVGISIVTTMLARGAQAHQTVLAAHMNPYNPAFQETYATLHGVLSGGPGPLVGGQRAYALLYQGLRAQSALAAYVDDFRILAAVCLVCVPGVLLFKKVRAHGPIAAH